MYNKRWARSSRKPLDSSFRLEVRHDISLSLILQDRSALYLNLYLDYFKYLHDLSGRSIEQVRTKNFSSYFSHFRSTLETRTFSFHILARRRCVRLSACVFKKTFRKVSFSWERRTESKGNEKKRTRGSYT